jgi:hypothetical protein
VNTAQQAIARWTGVGKELEARDDRLDEALAAVETVAGAYSLLERQLDELQYIDLYSATPGEKNVIISDEKRLAVLTRIRRLRHENPIAKQAVKLTLRFTLGNGIDYLIKDEALSDSFGEFWKDRENQAVLTGHKAMTHRLDETLTDGEQFVALFTAEAAPHVRLGLIPLEQVKEILYDPGNGEIPVWYKRIWYEREYDASLNDGEGGWKPEPPKPKVAYYRDYRIDDERLAEVEERGLKIPESKQALDDKGDPIYVKHRLINPVRMKSGTRGVSELFASRDWLYGYKNFMEDRLAMNAAAAALAVHRKIRGGPAKVAALRNTLGGISVTPEAGTQAGLLGHRYSRPAAGSILNTTDAEELKGIKIDTGAPSAALDANGLMTAVGAGVGHPVHYFGSSNTALASTQSIEIAVVKGYEDWQTWAKTDLNELADFVFSKILGDGSEVSAEEREIAWSMPPIMTKDVVKHITANAQMAQQIAPGNRIVKKIAIRNALAALLVPNIEQSMAEIEEDEKRLETEKEEQRELMLQAGMQPALPGNGKGNGAKPPVDGQKATTGPNIQALGPDDIRGGRGKPPRETTTGPRTSRQ